MAINMINNADVVQFISIFYSWLLPVFRVGIDEFSREDIGSVSIQLRF